MEDASHRRCSGFSLSALTMHSPTPYPELNSVLEELVGSVQAALDCTFVGACLQGSFAVGDFDRHSDVDFVITVRDELTGEQVDALREEIRATMRAFGQEILDVPPPGP